MNKAISFLLILSFLSFAGCSKNNTSSKVPTRSTTSFAYSTANKSAPITTTEKSGGSTGDIVSLQSPAANSADNQGLSSPDSTTNAAEAESLYNQAYNYHLSGDYGQAVKYSNDAIAKDDASYKAYSLKGIALSYMGIYEEGMQCIDKALELKPDYDYANFNKALSYKLQKKYDLALIWFNKTINYDPADTWSYFGIACIYAEWNDVDKAIDNLKKAIETDPDVKEAASTEHDLDNIREDDRFIDLIK